MSEFKRLTLLLTDIQQEKLKILQDKIGVKTMSGVYDMALDTLYNVTFKYGSDPMLNPNSGNIESIAERRVKIKQAEEKVKQDLKDKPKIDRCINTLKGEIVVNPDGSRMCKYRTHNVMNSDEQIVPLHQTGAYLEDGLFIPDKKTVLKNRPELREIFKD